MPRLIWAPPALQDVQRLHGFLAARNVDAAKRAVKAIRQGVQVLAQHPGLGRPVDDLPEAFREWAIDFGDSGYVARYRLEPDAVIVLAVRYQKEVGF